MPNWCDNTLNLHHENKEVLDELQAELTKGGEAELFRHFRPYDGEWDYGWCVENWGTKWEARIIDWERLDENSFVIYFETAWGPPITLYEFLEENDWNVEAFYYEPGMCFAGIYDNGHDSCFEYSDMSADQIEEELPHELNEMYGISEQRRDWEEENEDEDDEELEWPEPTEEVTFEELAKINPETEENAGMTEEEMAKALEELKAEFDELMKDEENKEK